MKYHISFLAFNLIPLISYGMEPEQPVLSTITQSDDNTIKIITSDEQELTISKALVKTIPTIRRLVEDVGSSDAINLNIAAQNFTKIVEYLEQKETQKITDELGALPQDQLVILINIANYLELTELLDRMLEVFVGKIATIKDIEPYIEHGILPADIGRRMLEISGASRFFIYKSALTLPCSLSLSEEKIFGDLKQVNPIFGRRKKEPIPLSKVIKSLYITQDKSTLIIEVNNAVYFCDLKKGTCFERFFSVYNVCFNESASLLAVSFNYPSPRVTISKIKNAKIATKPVSMEAKIPCCFSPDGSFLVLINEHDRSKACIVNTIKKASWIDCLIPKSTALMRITRDNADLGICSDETLSWYHVANGECYQTFNVEKRDFFNKFEFASDDNSVIALKGVNKINFYNFKDGTLISSISEGEAGKRSLLTGALNSDGSIWAMSGFTDPDITLYDVKNGTLIHRLKNQFLIRHQHLLRLNFALKDTLLNVIARDVTGKCSSSLWDVKSGQCIHCLEGICHLSLSSDSRLMAGCKDSDNTLCVWSIDENLEKYLSKEISIDQALLLLLAFKSQNNNDLVLGETSKLKTVYSSIAHKGLQAVLSNNFFKCTGGWVIEDETKKIAEDYQITGASPAHFIGDRTWVDETKKLQSPDKKRKRNESIFDKNKRVL